MNIRGLHKTSLIDYPGKICAIVFSGGCNLRCKYCHNPVLACSTGEAGDFTNEEVLSFIEKRRGLIDGVSLSGGEPTLCRNIEPFIRSLRELGLSIKIDTNGLNPRVIERLLNNDLLDYIATDVKTSPGKYEDLTGMKNAFPLLKRTIEIVKSSGVDYEIRTTCIPYYVTLEDFHSIKNEIDFVKKYYLQQFVNSVTLDSSLRECSPYPLPVLNEFKNFVQTFSDVCEVRGI
ncbi:MAG TPA: anaerobic ribonucleoside-triphosphate reductase activating protein [Spirochaetota bacterium]|nr:anaerobic ribonucleoside-triphosphate reductase activating protein [Spirochaetota bacterium]HPQ51609.1 anaerobic ribonucleoside-triphosphate reductase activating protein [Spirochaetota bacterium]